MKNTNHKNKNKKKLWLFVIPLLVVASLVSAGIVTDFFSGETTIEVTQPISVLGNSVYEIEGATSGDTILGDPITITNDASDGRQVQITSTTEEGITTNYVGYLELENKDSSWKVIDDGRNADLYYYIVGEDMGYKLDAEGLEDIEYSLIYYADSDPRFEDWGGNPAVLLGTGTAVGGILNLEGIKDIDSLPLESDWNTNCEEGDNYCNNGIDNYEHCYGAKIWLIPSSDYNTDTIKPNWNPTTYLFETDLIYYFENTDGIITIPANSYIEFYPLFNLDKDLMGGTYTITTSVLPY